MLTYFEGSVSVQPRLKDHGHVIHAWRARKRALGGHWGTSLAHNYFVHVNLSSIVIATLCLRLFDLKHITLLKEKSNNFNLH